jgi:stearoyl-CoA desaturase (delta-9 desaturase)
VAWIPFWAAGVINGLGHFWGYRNFSTEDASTNLSPWGILIGGEELHNNHHSYGTSARLSSKWYEFDIGWMYIRILEMLGLAKVKKLAPKVNWRESIGSCDLAMLQAVITHRYDVLARYGRSLRTTYQEEFGKLRDHGLSTSDRSVVDRLVIGDARVADEDRARVESVLKHSKVLETIYAMRVELSQLWQRSTASKEQLVRQLDDWCHRAETSGIAALGDFSRQLRRYA